ncbi:MAG TPA: acyl carrier protein [Jatrophihabitans sp.]|jgi:acyl carrier protein|uniref:acyl carrier protein n=1 Tax=Jatrophihabitans sp. TaxID=1932789 RepID=UPI002F1352AC
MNPRFNALLRSFLRFAGSEPITPESSLRDLGLDSMQAIELLFAVEDEFGYQLPDELMVDATFETAGSLWAAVTASSGMAGSEPGAGTDMARSAAVASGS